MTATKESDWGNQATNRDKDKFEPTFKLYEAFVILNCLTLRLYLAAIAIKRRNDRLARVAA